MSNCISAQGGLRCCMSAAQDFSPLICSPRRRRLRSVQTPLHFEHLLLSTMQEAMDWED